MRLLLILLLLVLATPAMAGGDGTEPDCDCGLQAAKIVQLRAALDKPHECPAPERVVDVVYKEAPPAEVRTLYVPEHRSKHSLTYGLLPISLKGSGLSGLFGYQRETPAGRRFGVFLNPVWTDEKGVSSRTHPHELSRRCEFDAYQNCRVDSRHIYLGVGISHPVGGKR